MSSRIPDPDLFQDYQRETESQPLLESARAHAKEHEQAFLDSLMDYIKHDEMLKSFDIRLIYECEVVQKVIDNRRDTDVIELADMINDMKEATSIHEVAKADATFHRRMFSIAEEVEFYEWFRLQSKGLGKFLGSFWSYIGYKTPYYEKLIAVHEDIFNGIKNRDKALALSAMREHFAILLFQLLSVTFQRGQKEPLNMEDTISRLLNQ